MKLLFINNTERQIKRIMQASKNLNCKPSFTNNLEQTLRVLCYEQIDIIIIEKDTDYIKSEISEKFPEKEIYIKNN